MNTVDKRGTMQSIPDSVKRMLNEDQMFSLRRFENFGWRIGFIRRPLFQEIVVVLTSYDGKEFGILETSGELNMHPSIEIREQTHQRPLHDQTPAGVSSSLKRTG